MTSRSNRQLVRISEVAAMLGVSKSTIYNWVKDDMFPKPIVLGDSDGGKNTASRWLLEEIDQWLDTRTRNRFGKGRRPDEKPPLTDEEFFERARSGGRDGS